VPGLAKASLGLLFLKIDEIAADLFRGYLDIYRGCLSPEADKISTK
jgi:hypothetical protein